MMETILDFYLLPHTDRDKLIILDASIYQEVAETPILSIVLPGFAKPISIPFIPKTTNIINTSLLGTSTLGEFNNFADGIYQFTYSICPNDQQQRTKYFLIDNLLQDAYSNKLISLLEYPNKQLEDKLNDVDILIQAAHIYAERGNPYLATERYKRANYLLSKIKTNC